MLDNLGYTHNTSIYNICCFSAVNIVPRMRTNAINSEEVQRKKEFKHKELAAVNCTKVMIIFTTNRFGNEQGK
jgi:hypothetical protein